MMYRKGRISPEKREGVGRGGGRKKEKWGEWKVGKQNGTERN